MTEKSKDFNYYLQTFEEVGYVEELLGSIVYVNGLPGVSQNEMVIFEDNTLGQVIGLDQEKIEVLLFSRANFTVGTEVARTDQGFKVPLSDSVLGKVLNPLGEVISSLSTEKQNDSPKITFMDVDSAPIDIMKRKSITKPLETGVMIVDLVIPIAKGQRELVIGDRNIGKTSFLKQTLVNQASQGTTCIYVAVGKKKAALQRSTEYYKKCGYAGNIIIVAADAAMPSGLNFIAPYTAMSVAEYFRNQGKDVLVVIDDLTSHARYYREISLLARRFPGRNSYPGDIFFIHSRLLERAGSFSKGTITCLPTAETIMGDLAGYIQTNLMAMTDGHIFFDKDMFDQGKFPAVNQFLSVTRVGLQAQPDLMRDISRILSNFLVRLAQIRQFMHFGSELGEEVKKMLSLGVRLDEFLKQKPEHNMPVNLSAFLLGVLWGGFWVNDRPKKLKADMLLMRQDYLKMLLISKILTRQWALLGN